MKLPGEEMTQKIAGNPIGDAAGEWQNMARGKYDASNHVLLARIIEGALVYFGLLFIYFHYFQKSSNNGTDLVIHATSIGIGCLTSYFVFRDRVKCVEAFSSRFCSGTSNFSVIYVPLLALLYSNYRAMLKVFGK